MLMHRVFYSIPLLLWPRGHVPPQNKPLRPTDHLDGLKGVAAFLVYVHHHVQWAHNETQFAVLERSFGYNKTYHIATFPWIRTLVTGGHFAVATFIAVSGYIMTIRPLELIHARDYQGLLDSIASSLFRRWIRLFVPVISTTFIFVTLWYALGIEVLGLQRQQTYGAELGKWYRELRRFSFHFEQSTGDSGYSPSFSYNTHLWTIPVEFRAFLINFTLLIATCKSSGRARIWCQLGAIFYFLIIVDGWYGAMSVLGMLLCAVDVEGTISREHHHIRSRSWPRQFLFSGLFVLGIFLGGVPHVANTKSMGRNPGWYYLSFLKPPAVLDPKWFYLFCSSSLVIAAVPRVPLVKRLLETQTCQYLGRISFGLYLIHGPLLWTIGDRLYAMAGWYGEQTNTAGAFAMIERVGTRLGALPLPRWGPLGLELAFLLPFLILLPLNLRVAEVAMELFDLPSVKLGNFLYRLSLADTSNHSNTNSMNS